MGLSGLRVRGFGAFRARGSRIWAFRGSGFEDLGLSGLRFRSPGGQSSQTLRVKIGRGISTLRFKVLGLGESFKRQVGGTFKRQGSRFWALEERLSVRVRGWFWAL